MIELLVTVIYSMVVSMPENTIHKIRQMIRQGDDFDNDKSTKLLNLVDKLESELNYLAQDDRNKAIEIAALAKDKISLSSNKGLDKPGDFNALEKLIVEYESSHPNLVSIVRSFCNSLSSMGI